MNRDYERPCSITDGMPTIQQMATASPAEMRIYATCNRADYRALAAAYGGDEIRDMLVDDPDPEVRLGVLNCKKVQNDLVSLGGNPPRERDLDVCVFDESPAVRAAVAAYGRDEDRDILVHDEDADVKVATVGLYYAIDAFEYRTFDGSTTRTSPATFDAYHELVAPAPRWHDIETLRTTAPTDVRQALPGLCTTKQQLLAFEHDADATVRRLAYTKSQALDQAERAREREARRDDRLALARGQQSPAQKAPATDPATRLRELAEPANLKTAVHDLRSLSKSLRDIADSLPKQRQAPTRSHGATTLESNLVSQANDLTTTESPDLDRS